MYISEHMTHDPLTISPETLLPEARQVLNEYYFRHLPVVDLERKLIGIISDRDLRSAYPSSVTTDYERKNVFERVAKTPVAEIMASPCQFLTLASTLDDALIVFDKHKLGAMPVVDDEMRVVGMFSIRDLTAAYKKLFGMAEKGSILIGISDDGTPGVMSRIVTLLEKHHISFTRLIRMNQGEENAKIYLRINTFRVVAVQNLLKDDGFLLLKH